MTSEEAKIEYAKLWDQFCNELDSAEMERLGMEMDELQPLIAHRPTDLAWQKFIDTLPGFKEYWASRKEVLLANLREQGNYER